LQTPDFTYVEDVIEAFLCTGNTAHVGGEVLNVCAGAETAVIELMDVLQDLLGTSLEAQFAPARPGEVARSVGDRSKAEREVGWVPQWSLREALQAWIEEASVVAG
jgi:UDP-glucose 4-epimerase